MSDDPKPIGYDCLVEATGSSLLHLESVDGQLGIVRVRTRFDGWRRNVARGCTSTAVGEGFTCVEDTRLDVVFGGSFADCLGSDRLSPQESAIEGAQTRGARREVRHLGLHRTGHVIF